MGRLRSSHPRTKNTLASLSQPHHLQYIATIAILVGTVTLWGWIYYAIFFWNITSTARNENDMVTTPQAGTGTSSSQPIVRLLSIPETVISTTNVNAADQKVYCTVTTDVRGNLGPPSVLLNNGTDWIHDRWQAASDMHGTNIVGTHWVQLTWTTNHQPQKSNYPAVQQQQQQPQSIVVSRIVLDWEAAYADYYDIQQQLVVVPSSHLKKQQPPSDGEWQTIVQSTSHNVNSYNASSSSSFSSTQQQQQISWNRTISQYGQSPGVESKTPLHVVHAIHIQSSPTPPTPTTSALRIFIHKSATGWGVSLWQIQVYGWYV